MPTIMDAIAHDDFLTLQKLVQQGADLNQIIENEDNENDECLIFYAIHKKCTFETLKFMIENGIDLHYTDKQGVSILDEAIIAGNLELIKYLLDEKDFDANLTKRKSGLTPLIQAACYGNIELVKLLIAHGASVHSKDAMNLSAADYARKLQRKKMLQFLEESL